MNDRTTCLVPDTARNSARNIVRSLAYLGILSACLAAPVAFSQSAVAVADSQPTLPDAPGFDSSPTTEAPDSSPAPNSASRADLTDIGSNAEPLAGNFTPPRVATKYDKYIDADETAPKLTGRDKFILGARATVTPFMLMSVLASAGLEQARNSSPNYGAHIDAFGQRVGASAARDTTETIFTDSILSPLLREDPRYFQLGDGHGVVARTFYAVSRVFVVKRDDGRLQANYALFGGYIGAIALTNAYYPQINRGFTQNAESFGGALGGAAFSRVFREFLSDGLQAAHLARR